jgi:hypothetical protein
MLAVMDTLPIAIANGWAAGISAYGTVLLLGLLGRFDVAETPEVLTRVDVLVVAGLLTLIELVADKVPVVDSLWDTVHTVIRPVTAAVIGVLLAGDASTLEQAVTASGMSGLALASHAAKTGIRLAVNTSPEPVTNIAVSLGEDVAVTAVVLLAWSHPWVAAGIAITLLVAATALAIALLATIRRGWRRLRGRRGAIVAAEP